MARSLWSSSDNTVRENAIHIVIVWVDMDAGRPSSDDRSDIPVHQPQGPYGDEARSGPPKSFLLDDLVRLEEDCLRERGSLADGG